MMRSETVEHNRLQRAMTLLSDAVNNVDDQTQERLQLLELVSCKHSGIPSEVYYRATGYKKKDEPVSKVIDDLYHAICNSGIPFTLALSSLARTEADDLATRQKGAIYTDFRLARYLAKTVMCNYEAGAILDPACGTSIILAACADYLQSKMGDVAAFVAENLYGMDVSPHAIRGSILTLASMLKKESELVKLTTHFQCGDSLELGLQIPSQFGLDAFEFVVGNPPWERLKPSKNEYARGKGLDIKYGQDIAHLPAGYERYRNNNRKASQQLANDYRLNGGIDLYRAFLALSTSICADSGTVSLYLPAGLIRSKNLAQTREQLLNDFEKVQISVFVNQEKFFSIDSRFKFLLAVLAGKQKAPHEDGIALQYCTADKNEVAIASKLALDSDFFCDSSGELGAPEVRTDEEARILRIIWDNSQRMKQHPLFSAVKPKRELDMTLDKDKFIKNDEGTDDALPLIEGRMISPYRCGSKEYLYGTGRCAKWRIAPPGINTLKPQYFVPREKLDEELLDRCNKTRIGFCDIAGQTNERAMQAAIVPADCVCGNKVPTLLFEDQDAAMLWLGIVNSFAFDWIIRRYITTTINFFILANLPIPNLEVKSETAQNIIASVKEIVSLETKGTSWDSEDYWRFAEARAKIDASVFNAYGLDTADFDIIAADFPLVDQANTKLTEGIYPTIELARAHICNNEASIKRAKSAWENGACPYIPNEHVRSMMTSKTQRKGA